MIPSKEAVLTQTLVLLPPPKFLGEILNVLIQQFELFWVLILNPRSHTHAMLFIVTFYLLFGWVTTNFESLARRQFHSPDANYWVFIIFSCEGQWKSSNNGFFKTWDGLHLDAQIQRLTYRQTEKTQKSKNLTNQHK